MHDVRSCYCFICGANKCCCCHFRTAGSSVVYICLNSALVQQTHSRMLEKLVASAYKNVCIVLARKLVVNINANDKSYNKLY